MDIEKEINSIKERNIRVEVDKDWEKSFPRRIFIALITYLVVFAFLVMIEVPKPSLAALVPVGGYIFSTLSLGFLRSIWGRYYKNEN
ncbi:MAG: hypothetical protein AAB597_02050 [Patescibacteria group bacterium]